MSNITIAEILHRAADEHLNVSDCPWDYIQGQDRFSCCAIDDAIDHLFDGDLSHYGPDRLCEQIIAGLRAMGLEPEDCYQFEDVPYNDRQGARYAWLKFAAMIAEEQGV